jgi:hypothetical protein
LFFGVLLAALLALGAGIDADNHSEIVDSNLLYRLIVGAIVFAILYAAAVIGWLAWHRRTLKKLNVGPAGGETPDQATGGEISARDEEIKEFMETTTKVVAELDARLSELEK